MKYAVLVYLAEQMWLDADQSERDAYHQAHVAFAAAVAAREDVTQVAGEALATVATATTLRRDADGRPQVVDGPFAETTEVLGGFYLLEAPDLDTVLELCTLLPAPYALEVRPVAEVSDDRDWAEASRAVTRP